MKRTNIRLQDGPFVVGTLSSFAAPVTAPVDLVEVRLDKTGCPADWPRLCRLIGQAGLPVLLTIRLRAEGGEWPEDDAARLNLYREGVGSVAGVDVELGSKIGAEVARAARESGAFCVLSHHDFEKTPALGTLAAIVERAHAHGAAAKVATMIRSEADVDVLRTLLRMKWPQPLCVIAMGDAWKQTRIEFPKAGSCLTYGYLDQPTAPGQISAAELFRCVHSG